MEHAARMHPGQEGKDYPNPNFPPKMNVDEKLASLDNVPLFMRDLPNEKDKAADPGRETSDVALEALQNLAHSGSPEEIAQNFKDKGNQYYQGKRYSEAVAFYTQGLQAKPPPGALERTLRLNRAACNLELRNFRQVILDTEAVLQGDALNEKAYYRRARAQIALKKIDDAFATLSDATKHNVRNDALRRLAQQVQKAFDERRRRQEESAEQARRTNLNNKALTQAILARGLLLSSKGTAEEAAMAATGGDTGPRFVPEAVREMERVPLSQPEKWSPPDPIRTQLQFPVVVHYPGLKTNEWELLPQWEEDATVQDGLSALLVGADGSPSHPNWREGYTIDGINAYVLTRDRRLLRAGLQRSLREVIDAASRESEKESTPDGLVLNKGSLLIFVAPRGSQADKNMPQLKSTWP